MLTLNNITCTRGDTTLFKNLAITLGDCMMLAIYGGNGCGKTSLLKIIAGILEPTSGDVVYANEKLHGEHYKEYCQMIQYIGHENALKPGLTVKENLLFWAKLKKTPELVPAAIKYFGLDNVQNMAVARLSAGMQRRVALAKLVACNADIWLLDEPYTHLDDEMKTRVSALITSRCDQGGVVVMTAHDKVSIEGCQELHIGDWQ